jgi:hypothetical protein
MYEALKQVRRQQFETLVMTTLLLQDQDEEADKEKQERAYLAGKGRPVTSGYGKAI